MGPCTNQSIDSEVLSCVLKAVLNNCVALLFVHFTSNLPSPFHFLNDRIYSRPTHHLCGVYIVVKQILKNVMLSGVSGTRSALFDVTYATSLAVLTQA